MAGTFTIDPGWIKNLQAGFDVKLDDLSKRMLTTAEGYAPVSGTPKTASGRKAHKARHHRHMKSTGRVIEADGGHGGFEFMAPYTWFVERGHKTPGAGHTTGSFFMFRALLAHAEEIESGSFLG